MGKTREQLNRDKAKEKRELNSVTEIENVKLESKLEFIKEEYHYLKQIEALYGRLLELEDSTSLNVRLGKLVRKELKDFKLKQLEESKIKQEIEDKFTN